MQSDKPEIGSTSFTVLTILVGLAFVLLIAGLVCPIATMDRLFLDPDTYSVLEGIGNLITNQSWGIALLILGFSVIFPLGKLLVLVLTLVQCRQKHPHTVSLRWLEILGKWSMLDVFVIAVTFSAANLGLLSDVQVRYGIYLYASAILLSMLATFALSNVLNSADDTRTIHSDHDWLARVLHLCITLTFMAGILLPLVIVEKWVFWENQYSLLSALPHLIAEGEWLMPIVLGLFVILLPALHLLMQGMSRWSRELAHTLEKPSGFIAHWAMFDVYVLAMLVVFLKLSDSAAVQPQWGFWALLCAAILSLVDRWREHQAT